MGPGFVCSRGCTAAPLTEGLWFDCIDVQDLLGTVVASLAQCSGRPAGRRTWVGFSKKLIIRVFQNNVLFANVIVVSLSSGQVNRIVVCGFSKCTSNYLKGIALSKLLVELKSPQHAIKVQILSSSMKMSFLLLPLNKFYQFQLLLCLCCEKLSFLGDFGVEKVKWGQGNVGRSQNQSCPPQPPFVKYGRCHYWVAMVGMF